MNADTQKAIRQKQNEIMDLGIRVITSLRNRITEADFDIIMSLFAANEYGEAVNCLDSIEISELSGDEQGHIEKIKANMKWIADNWKN